MIRNNYVFELPEFETSDLFEFVKTKIPSNWHTKDNDKIVCRHNPTRSWLGKSFNIYQLKKGAWPKHVDLGRSCSLNIPYKNCDDTKVTRFYKPKEELKYGTIYDSFSDAKNKIIGFITSELELDYEHVLRVPTIIRNDVPHDVINYNDDIRIILSWTCNKKFYEVLKEI